MKNSIRHLILVIALLSSISLPLVVRAEEPMQPYVSYTTCPNCGNNSYALIRKYNDSWYGPSTTTQCPVSAIYYPNHQHRFEATCRLSKCSDCGYSHTRKEGHEYCEEGGLTWGYNEY